MYFLLPIEIISLCISYMEIKECESYLNTLDNKKCIDILKYLTVDFKESILSNASGCRHIRIVKILLKDLGYRSHYAIIKSSLDGNTDITGLLLDYERLIFTERDEIALMYASLYGYTSIVRLLLYKNLKINYHIDNTVLDKSLNIAMENQHEDVVYMLMNYMKNVSDNMDSDI